MMGFRETKILKEYAKNVKVCACGCGDMATHPYVKLPNGDVLASRTCYEKYAKEHPPVYGPQQAHA
jgi:hypothetical protein